MVPSEPSDPSGEALLGASPQESSGGRAGAGASPYTQNDDLRPVNNGVRVGRSSDRFARPALLREISVQLQRTSQDSLVRTWRSLLNRYADTPTKR